MRHEKDYYQHHKDDLDELCKAILKGCCMGVAILVISLVIGMLMASFIIN